LANESGDDNPFAFSYKIDAKGSPIEIDFNIEGGPFQKAMQSASLKWTRTFHSDLRVSLPHESNRPSFNGKKTIKCNPLKCRVSLREQT